MNLSELKHKKINELASLARDQRSAAEIQGIIDAQMPLKGKVSRADYVVDNRGCLDETQRQVQIIWEKLQKII